MTSREGHFEAVYRLRIQTGHEGWCDHSTECEIRGYLDELLGIVGITNGNALELGCGTGALTLPLARRGFEVLGIDISGTAITEARRRAQGEEDATARRVRFLKHDATEPLPGQGDRFDLIIDALMLHHVTARDDRAQVLRIARRELHATGSMLIMTMCGDPRWLPPDAFFDSTTRCLVTAGVAECFYARSADLAAEFEDAGFTVTYARVESGDDVTGDQDMYLAVLRTSSPILESSGRVPATNGCPR